MNNRKFAFLSLILTWFVSTSAVCQRCVRGNCVQGFGTQILGPNSRYTGEFVNGLRDGKGIFYYANGNKYIGEWKKNKMNGEGKLVYSNGNEFTGSFIADKIQGKGSMQFKNGDKYTGEWQLDFPHGSGAYYFAKGDRYEGQFVQGKLQGQGSFYYKDGSKYIGSWVANKRNGYGEFTNTEGKLTMGQWEADKLTKLLEENKPATNIEIVARENADKKILENQDEVEAYVREEESDALMDPDVDTVETYVLEEESAKPVRTEQKIEEIAPTQIRENEKTKTKEKELQKENSTGQKPQSELASESRIEKENTVVINTDAQLPDCNKEYCKKGKGILLYGDGSKYVGNFVDGEPRGKGICYYANGDRYEGMWANHAPNGEGVMHFTSGLVYGAIWENGNAKKQLHSRQDFVFNDKIISENSPEVKIWAVVVGIARYEHMPALKYSDDDAYKIYAFLKSPEGGALKDNQIRVLIDEDATRHQILKGMNEIFMKADENDVVMLYFSGHGLEGTFLPIDYDGFTNSIQHEEVKEIFSKSRAKHKVCYADACHSGSLLAAKGPFSSSLMYFYDELDKESGGTAFVMSSKSKEYSLEDGGLRQGIFSHFLIRGIKGEADLNHNKTITIKELFNFVSQKVREYTGNAQTPMIAGDYNENMPVGFVRED